MVPNNLNVLRETCTGYVRVFVSVKMVVCVCVCDV